MNLDLLLRPIAMRRDLHAAFELALGKFMPPGAVVYDIGCGQKPFASFLAGRVGQHVGVDLADGFYKPHHVDLIGTAYAVPAEDGVADAVILSQVIEHLAGMLTGQGFELMDKRRIGGYWYLMGMYSVMYFSELDRGILRRTGLIKLACAALGWVFLALHKGEALALRLAGKDPERMRARWTANYLPVLRKTPACQPVPAPPTDSEPRGPQKKE